MKPTKPYYAVIFTSKRTTGDNDYGKMADQMLCLAQKQKGFIGVESAREEVGITVSYWETLEDIQNWKDNTEHLAAQKKGKKDWYASYHVRICKVEREYKFVLK